MGSKLRRVLGQSRRALVGGLLAGACGLVAAQAQPNGVTSTVSGLTTRINTPSANGYWIPQVDGQNFRFGTTAPVGAPGGKAANATLRAGVSRALVGKFMAGALKALPIVGTGVALWELYDLVRVRPNGAGGLAYDEGVAPQPTVQVQWCFAGTEVCVATLGELLVVFKEQVPTVSCGAVEGSVPSQARITFQNANEAGLQRYHVCPGAGEQIDGGTLAQRRETEAFGCAPGPGGVTPQPGADGRCPTGEYAPITEEDAAEKLDPLPSGDWIPAIEDALDRAPLPLPTPAEITEVAPNPVPGPTSVTTGPNGIKETETEYVPQPGAGRIDWKERETTTTTDPNGNVTEETTETGGREDDQKDPCETRPNTIGCIELGDPPVDELVLQDRQVSITPMSGWGADNASCPTGQTFTVMGHSYSLSYEPLCQFSGAMRAVVLAGAWIAAAFIVLGIRSGGEDG